MTYWRSTWHLLVTRMPRSSFHCGPQRRTETNISQQMEQSQESQLAGGKPVGYLQRVWVTEEWNSQLPLTNLASWSARNLTAWTFGVSGFKFQRSKRTATLLPHFLKPTGFIFVTKSTFIYCFIIHLKYFQFQQDMWTSACTCKLPFLMSFSYSSAISG